MASEVNKKEEDLSVFGLYFFSSTLQKKPRSCTLQIVGESDACHLPKHYVEHS